MQETRETGDEGNRRKNCRFLGNIFFALSLLSPSFPVSLVS